MAEFVQKKVEDMRPILEHLLKLQLFTEPEIRGITKKLKEHEYKLQRHSKLKEDYLRYIQYQMDLLKLVKQRREKHGITHKKSEIDFSIANKINHLYKDAIFKFQNDLRFWIAYMTFCKHVKFQSNVTQMLGKMLSVHQDKPKCWHIAARWEIEENNDLQNAKNLLFRGIYFHPESQLLYNDLFRLELNAALTKNKKYVSEKESENLNKNNEINSELNTVFAIYNQAITKIKDIKFIINLLNITQEYENTEKLQQKIIGDIIKDYSHEPLMWDIMAKRELNGLIQPALCTREAPMEVDNTLAPSLRDRLSSCYEVYQTAVKKIKTKEMWSLFIDCMIEINQEISLLPNYKRKLLKNALLQAHQAKKLQEKYYLNWIDMLSTSDSTHKGSKENDKLYGVLCWATEALPESENLWRARLEYLFKTHQDDLAVKVFNKAVEVLGENSLSLWKLRLLYIKAGNSENLEEFFKHGLKNSATISNYIKPIYMEYIVLTKDINATRKIYEELCLYPFPCLELHKKMVAFELAQFEPSLQYIRKVYEMMTLQFGKENIHTWLEFVIFEMKFGEPERASNIYNRAIKVLNRCHIEKFINEYSSIKANTDSLKIPL